MRNNMMKHYKNLQYCDEKDIESNIRFVCSYLNDDYIRRGIDWYPDAKKQLLEYKLEHDSKLDYIMIAQMTSVFSSRSKWNVNLHEIENVLSHVKHHGSNLETNNMLNNRVYSTKDFYKKAWKSFNNELVFFFDKQTRKTCKKTGSFFYNLLLDNSFVTLDVHMSKCIARNHNEWFALLLDEGIASKNIYTSIENLVLKIAEEYNLKGYELQASLWLLIQDLYEDIKDNIKPIKVNHYYSPQKKMNKSQISNSKNNYNYV